MCDLLGYTRETNSKWYRNEIMNDETYVCQNDTGNYLTELGLYACLMLSKKIIGK